MTAKETKASVKFTAKLVESTSRNFFTNLPDDVNTFLSSCDGTMQGIVENLNPGQLYEIKISVKSV